MSEVRILRARDAALTRHRGPTDPATLAVRRDLRAAKLEAYITRTVDAIPPLTDQQRQKLADILRPVANRARAAEAELDALGGATDAA